MFKEIFWRGIKATVPLLVTLALAIWVFSILESFFGRIIIDIFGKDYYFTGLGCIIGILFVFCVGTVLNLWMVQSVYGYGERLVKRIPIIKTIYSSIEDLVAFFDPKRQGKSGLPVILETDLGKVIAFVTVNTNLDLPPDLRGDDNVAVYIPLSYQIGGMMVFVPRSKVTPLDFPVDKAMSYVITAGMTGQNKKDVQNPQQQEPKDGA